MEMVNKLVAFTKEQMDKLKELDKKENPIRPRVNDIIRKAVDEYLEKKA